MQICHIILCTAVFVNNVALCLYSPVYTICCYQQLSKYIQIWYKNSKYYIFLHENMHKIDKNDKNNIIMAVGRW